MLHLSDFLSLASRVNVCKMVTGTRMTGLQTRGRLQGKINKRMLLHPQTEIWLFPAPSMLNGSHRLTTWCLQPDWISFTRPVCRTFSTMLPLLYMTLWQMLNATSCVIVADTDNCLWQWHFQVALKMKTLATPSSKRWSMTTFAVFVPQQPTSIVWPPYFGGSLPTRNGTLDMLSIPPATITSWWWNKTIQLTSKQFQSLSPYWRDLHYRSISHLLNTTWMGSTWASIHFNNLVLRRICTKVHSSSLLR